MVDAWQIDWEEKGFSHDGPQLSRPRPDFELRATVHRNVKAFAESIQTGEWQLQSATGLLDSLMGSIDSWVASRKAWRQSEARLAQLMMEYRGKVRGFRKLTAPLTHRQLRSQLKRCRADRDGLIVSPEVTENLLKFAESLSTVLENLCSIEREMSAILARLIKSLDDWDAMVSEPSYWQGDSYWLDCRRTAPGEIASRRANLYEFAQRRVSWSKGLQAWSKSLNDALANSAIELKAN